jgi:hypothetical protein
MSLIKIYTINCDIRVDGCRGWVGQEDTVQAVNRLATQERWHWIPGPGLDGRHVCPNCQRKQELWPT